MCASTHTETFPRHKMPSPRIVSLLLEVYESLLEELTLALTSYGERKLQRF